MATMPNQAKSCFFFTVKNIDIDTFINSLFGIWEHSYEAVSQKSKHIAPIVIASIYWNTAVGSKIRNRVYFIDLRFFIIKTIFPNI